MGDVWNHGGGEEGQEARARRGENTWERGRQRGHGGQGCPKRQKASTGECQRQTYETVFQQKTLVTVY